MTVSLRISYSRNEEAMWLGHLDMMRTFERAVRRARIPVAHTQGYNPRPRLAFALPIGVGVATKEDLLDLVLADQDEEPEKKQLAIWQESLNKSLPEGIKVIDLGLAPAGPSLMSQVTAALYELATSGLAAAVARLQELPQGSWLVERTRKEKTTELDIRPLVLGLEPAGLDCFHLHALAGSRKNLRPDLFLQFLVENCGLDPLAAADCRITRIRLQLGG